MAVKRSPEAIERRKARKRDLYAADPQKYKDRVEACRKRNPERNLVKLAKARAKLKGLDFDITWEDIVIPTHCPVLGIELSLRNKKGFCDTSPTIDRIDNSKGYIKNNICIISWRANSLKRDSTLEELEAVVAYMKNNV